MGLFLTSGIRTKEFTKVHAERLLLRGSWKKATKSEIKSCKEKLDGKNEVTKDTGRAEVEELPTESIEVTG